MSWLRCTISKGNLVKFARFVLLADLYIFTRSEINYQFHLLLWPFFFRLVYSKTIIRFGFCDIQNNQGLCKGYQPKAKDEADNPYLDLDHSGYCKNLIQ